MPLPKPPSKKGDLLPSADYDAQAAPRNDKRAAKTDLARAAYGVSQPTNRARKLKRLTRNKRMQSSWLRINLTPETLID